MSHSSNHSLAFTLAGVTALVVAFALPSNAAADPIDGSYSGTSSVVPGGTSGTCSKDFKYSAKVVNGGFLYTWDSASHVTIPIKIAADGTVSGEGGASTSNPATASGKLTGRALEIDLKGKQCSRHLSLKKA